MLALDRETSKVYLLGAASSVLPPWQARALGRLLAAAAVSSSSPLQPSPVHSGGPVPSRMFTLTRDAPGVGWAQEARAPRGRQSQRRCSLTPQSQTPLSVTFPAADPGSGKAHYLTARAWTPGQAPLREVEGYYFSGLSSWAPGQLEMEASSGLWYAVRVSDTWAVVQECKEAGGGDEAWRAVLARVGGLHGLVARAPPPTHQP